MELRLGFMASHNGSNVEAIIGNIENKNLEALAKVVISNNSDAEVLKMARDKNIPYTCLSSKNYPDFNLLEQAIIGTMRDNDVNLVILAGYMKLLGEDVVNAYRNRILNIHPSLLPNHGGRGMYGIRIHEAVINSDDEETGATVHVVNGDYDDGRILAQCIIPRYERDTPETLAERVLRFEHVLYSQVLRDIQKGIINLDE